MALADLINDGSFAVRAQIHRDGRWECMDFDSEGGCHRCAHCGAKYHHDDGVIHAEDCPHAAALSGRSAPDAGGEK